MRTTKDILNWNFKPSDFKYTSEHLFTSVTKSLVKSLLLTLDNYAKDSSGTNIPETKLVSDVYNLFQKSYASEYSSQVILYSKRDVRVLVWALDYKPTSISSVILFTEQFYTAKTIIIDKWKDSFIISLWHILLKNWNMLIDYQEQRNILIRLLRTKSNMYKGNRKGILNISNNINLFLSPESPKQYANILLQKNILVNDAHLLINQKDSIFVYEYFASVIINYVDFLKETTISLRITAGIFSFLELHNSRYTSLVICSALINRNKFENYLDLIKNQSVQLIGDPINKQAWRLSSLSDSESSKVELARKKLNVLLNKDFINIFFERLVQDNRRKRYWLKFIDEINDIKFVGNRSNYRYLRNIESISKYVDTRYKVTKRNQQTSALVIYSKKYVFVVFSDIGALYIFKQQSFKVNLNTINSMEDLKTWSRYKFACKNSEQNGYVILNEEGRFIQSGNWETRLDVWMRKYYHD